MLTWQTLKYQTDAQLSYRVNNGFDAGGIARLDGSFQYRVWRSRGTVSDYLYGVIEAELIQQSQNKMNGVNDSNYQ